MRHEHTHIYGICKVNAGPFARAFPSADFYAVDQHYSNPILPPALTPTLTPPPTLTLALAPTPNPNPNQVDDLRALELRVAQRSKIVASGPTAVPAEDSMASKFTYQKYLACFVSFPFLLPLP